MAEHSAEKGAHSTPPCPLCGHALTAAYDDGEGFWECDGCGKDFESHRAFPLVKTGDNDEV